MKVVRRLPSPLFVSTGMCVLFLAGAAVCQKKHAVFSPDAVTAPSAVTTALHTIFPNAGINRTDVIKRDGATLYRLGIIDGGKRREVVFSPDGVISEVIDSIGTAALPGPVQQALSRNYPRAKIIQTSKKTTGAGYEYKIETVVEKDTLELTFSETSMLVSSKRCAKKGMTEKNSGLAKN